MRSKDQADFVKRQLQDCQRNLAETVVELEQSQATCMQLKNTCKELQTALDVYKKEYIEY